MTDRENYRVKVQHLIEKEVVVLASDLDEAELKGKEAALNATGWWASQVVSVYQETSS
jgi:hypothetical protein